MSESKDDHVDTALERIRAQAAAESVRVTLHAQQEMSAEEITLDDVLQAIACGQIVEDYPEHRRGACCLLNGLTASGRTIHVVCTTAVAVLVIITVYEPRPPRWITPTERSKPDEV
jgi:hypothetical protein